jgi:hypothetical protein
MIERDAGQQVWKFILPIEDEITIKMPKNAQILHLDVQEQVGPCIWALCHTVASMEERKFFVVGTGHAMPVKAGRHIGSFQLLDGRLIFHVFEEAAGDG